MLGFGQVGGPLVARTACAEYLGGALVVAPSCPALLRLLLLVDVVILRCSISRYMMHMPASSTCRWMGALEVHISRLQHLLVSGDVLGHVRGPCYGVHYWWLEVCLDEVVG